MVEMNRINKILNNLENKRLLRVSESVKGAVPVTRDDYAEFQRVDSVVTDVYDRMYENIESDFNPESELVVFTGNISGNVKTKFKKTLEYIANTNPELNRLLKIKQACVVYPVKNVDDFGSDIGRNFFELPGEVGRFIARKTQIFASNKPIGVKRGLFHELITAYADSCINKVKETSTNIHVYGGVSVFSENHKRNNILSYLSYLYETVIVITNNEDDFFDINMLSHTNQLYVMNFVSVSVPSKSPKVLNVEHYIKDDGLFVSLKL